MGSTRWSNEEYHDRARHRAEIGADAFEYDQAIRQGEAPAGVHPKMNPLGVNLRESRDSQAHPVSHAVAVLFDVTGSMQTVPRVLQANLPRLMDLLIDKSYLDHPQIMIGAIGDATCDTAPLQVGQFESGLEIEDDLAKLYLEGGGGGQITESYELAAYFMAQHTSIDCYLKRQERGYLFIIGDEAPYPRVKRREIEKVLGYSPKADIPFEKLLAELTRTWDTYFVIPRMTQHWNNASVHQRWVQLLGQNVLRLDKPAAICELIAGTIGLAQNRVGLDQLADDLQETGTSRSVARSVGQALAGRKL